MKSPPRDRGVFACTRSPQGGEDSDTVCASARGRITRMSSLAITLIAWCAIVLAIVLAITLIAWCAIVLAIVLAITLIAWCVIVLALTAYAASAQGIEYRGHRSRIWLALTGAFLGIALAAVAILLARLESIVQ